MEPVASYHNAITKFEANCCFYCSDPLEDNGAICIHCGSIMCIGSEPGGFGCILANTLADEENFECPNCITMKSVGSRIIPYYIAGSGLRRTPKMNWPALIITLKLEEIDSPAIGMLDLIISSSYRSQLENVRVFYPISQSLTKFSTTQLKLSHIQMQGASQVSVRGNKRSHLRFINSFIQEERPPNLIILVDTHSNAWSGQLQTAETSSGGESNSTLPSIVDDYVGDQVIARMKVSSELARSYNVQYETASGKKPWADITPKTRGGWRVLIMPVCGSSVRQPVHLNYLVQMIRE